MMFTCNIDQRGKTMRLVVGALVEAIGLLLGALWFLEWTPAWTAWPALAIWLAGIFVLLKRSLVGARSAPWALRRRSETSLRYG